MLLFPRQLKSCFVIASLDRFNTSLFIFSTCHPVGGTLLGILMTSDEKEETIQAALQMLGDLLPQNAFLWQWCTKGQAVVMTDDSITEKGALTNNVAIINSAYYASSTSSKGGELGEGKNKIYKDDRAVLINLVKLCMVYAPSEILLNQRYDEFKRNSTVLKYPRFLQHIESLYHRCHEWA